VWGVRCRVWGAGYRVQGAGCSYHWVDHVSLEQLGHIPRVDGHVVDPVLPHLSIVPFN
jgi:hypothetical protein